MENQVVATVATSTAPAPTVAPAVETKPVEAPKPTEPKKEAPKADSAEVEKLKLALSKANSEAADYKRQLREKQTEAEREAAERAEADKAKDDELQALRKQVAVTDYTNRCVTLGFDGELASKTAAALADGNMDSVFDCLKAFVETTKTKLANDALNRQPSLSAGTPPTSNNVDTETEQLRRWMGAPTHRNF